MKMKSRFAVLCALALSVSVGCDRRREPANAPVQPVATPKVLEGFDVSDHQGKIQWQDIDPKSFQFVFVKASQGLKEVDPS